MADFRADLIVNSLLLHAGFAAFYVLLDTASFIHPLYGLNITPWNPAPALGLVFLLRRQRAGWLPLIATVLLSEYLVRGIPQSWWSSLLSALILAGGYIALGEMLSRLFTSSRLLDERRHLVNWIVAVTLGTLTISLVYVSSLYVLGLLPTRWLDGVLQFWVGDAVGIAVAMPLFWWLSNSHGRSLLSSAFLRKETAGYIALSLLVLWFVFDPGDKSGFKLFYLLFLPIIWASARQGMAGAIISSSLLQVEVIAAVQIMKYSAVNVAELQLLSFAMTLIGFFIGCVVDELQRTSNELKQTLRLAAAAEMTGALAHELNQPLTALTAYASGCEILLERGEQGERFHEAIRGMLRESRRAGEVVRRLRDFFRTGATRLEIVSLREIIEQAARRYHEKMREQSIAFTVGDIPDVRLHADRLQLELVFRNLLNNAIDAVCPDDGKQGWIRLAGELRHGNSICILVEDSGNGLSEKHAASLFEPFLSSKPSGLGLGLVISRAIVETHGGELWGEVANHGIFRVSLPIHEATENV